MEGIGRKRLLDSGQPSAVTQHQMYRQLALSGLSELRPVASYESIQIQLSLINESMNSYGGQSLTRRIDVDDRISAPRRLSGADRESRPEIYDQSPIHRDSDRSADIVPVSEILVEGIANAIEGRITMSLDVHDTVRLNPIRGLQKHLV